MTIGVLYLARLAEGFDHISTFAQSYRWRRAGHAHELVVIAKGFEAPSDFAQLAMVFEGIPHRIIPFSDSVGFDIHAFRLAAEQIEHDYVCCLNTFSVLRADNWLKKLYDAVSRPDIGMVGATGSFESLRNLMQVVARLEFVLKYPAAYDGALTRDFAWLVPALHPPTAQARSSLPARIGRRVSDIWQRRAYAIIPEHQRDWTAAVLNNPHHFLQQFPVFPNPHIRSNAFMLSRADFLGTPLQESADKSSAMVFESGRNGMSGSVFSSGRRLLVVGADGRGYELPEWPTCGAFRSRDQFNVLVADNHVAASNAMSPEVKQTHRIMTWGLPEGVVPPTLLQVLFDSSKLLAGYRARITST